LTLIRPDLFTFTAGDVHIDLDAVETAIVDRIALGSRRVLLNEP